MLARIKGFVKNLKPKSEYDKMVDYFSESVDLADLENRQKQWDSRSRHRHIF